MEKLPYLVRLGNRGISLRHLALWWDGATEPRPRDLAPGDIRIEVTGGIMGTVWDLSGPEADAFRSLVIPVARSLPEPEAEPGAPTADTDDRADAARPGEPTTSGHAEPLGNYPVSDPSSSQPGTDCPAGSGIGASE